MAKLPRERHEAEGEEGGHQGCPNLQSKVLTLVFQHLVRDGVLLQAYWSDTQGGKRLQGMMHLYCNLPEGQP